MKTIYKVYLCCVTIVVFFFVMLGIWAIDIGITGMANNLQATNGWWIRDACQQYHIGLFLVGIGTLCLTMLVISLIMIFPIKV